MNIQISALSKLLLILCATVIPMYFTDLRILIFNIILRPADLMSIGIICLFCVCVKFNKLQFFTTKGYGVLIVFVTYSFLNSFTNSGLFIAIHSTIQWVLIFVTLAIVYCLSTVYPQEFRKYFFGSLLTISIFVVLFHFSIGKFYQYKSLGDAKYIFALTCVVLLIYSYHFKDKSYLPALCILYPFLILSLERKGILGFHVVLIFILFFLCHILFKIILSVLFVITILALLFKPLSFDFDTFYIFKYNSYEMLYLDEVNAPWISNLHRQSLLENGWDIFLNNPLFGTGAKSLTRHMELYYSNPDLAMYTHNVFLDLLIEQGLVGMFLLLLPYFIYMFTTEQRTKKSIISFVAFCLYSIIMLLFMSAGTPSILIFFLPLFSGFIIKNKSYINIG